MTDKQLDEIDQAMLDGAVTWYQLERLTAEVRRLRELERAVRAITRQIQGQWNIYEGEQSVGWYISGPYVQAIGRLLEGKEADGIVTTQWVTDQKRELTQDTTTYRKLITQEWPDKQEAEGE